VVLAEEGRRRLEFRVVIDLSTPAATWAVPMSPHVHEDLLTLNTGGSMVISEPEYGSLYDITGELPPPHLGPSSEA
jgi:hypothetical protein